jgi:hypothetical protein
MRANAIRVWDARGPETAEIRSANTLYRLIYTNGADSEGAIEEEIERFGSGECPIPVLLVQGMPGAWVFRGGMHGRMVKGPAAIEFASAQAICCHMDRTDLAILRTSEFQDSSCGPPKALLNGSFDTPRFVLDVASAHACNSEGRDALETLHLAARIPGVWQRLDLNDGETAMIVPERAYFRIISEGNGSRGCA